MSGTLLFKNGLMIAACAAGMTLTACTSSGYGNSNNSRYGNVYDYESGACNGGPSACGATVAAPVSTRYGGSSVETTRVIGGQTVSQGPVYADCSAVSGMNCGAAAPRQQVQIYNPPATTYGASVQCPSGTTPASDGSCMQSGSYGYSAPTTTTSTYGGETASCPAGTTAAGDGTCMQSGGNSTYTGSTSYGGGSTYTGSTSYGGETASCPAGTTAAGDGTCMESGSGYTGYSSSTSSHSYSSTTTSGERADCPAGTTPNGDGTCMEGSNSNVVIYNGSNTTGYEQPQGYNPPSSYLPIRK